MLFSFNKFYKMNSKETEEVKSFDELEIIDFKHLGQGYIAKVKVAKHRVTGKEYAVKIVG